MKGALFFLYLFALSCAYPDGAPDAACFNMIPQHGVDPTSGEAPYDIRITNEGNVLTARIEADQPDFPSWKGLLIVATSLRGAVAGPLIHISDDNEYQAQCDNGVTHRNNGEKSFAEFKWEIPELMNVQLRIVMVKDRHTFWVFRRTHVILRTATQAVTPRIRDLVDAGSDGRPRVDELSTPSVVAPPDVGEDSTRLRVNDVTSAPITARTAVAPTRRRAPVDIGDDSQGAVTTTRRMAPADIGGDEQRARLTTPGQVAPVDIGEDRRPTPSQAVDFTTTTPTTTTTVSEATARHILFTLLSDSSTVRIPRRRLANCGVTLEQVLGALGSRQSFLEFLQCVFPRHFNLLPQSES